MGRTTVQHRRAQLRALALATAVLVAVTGPAIPADAAAVPAPTLVSASGRLVSGEPGKIDVDVANPAARLKKGKITLKDVSGTGSSTAALVQPASHTFGLGPQSSVAVTFTVTPRAVGTRTFKACTITGARRTKRCLKQTLEVFGPSSQQLIERAEKAGTLDAETALLYLVYAVYGDDRLPEAYRGDDSAGLDDVWPRVVEAYDSLSQDAKDALAPFGVPPYYGGSWWDIEDNGAATTSSAAPPRATTSATTPGCTGVLLTEDWESVATANGAVRIWYQTRYKATDETLANDIANEIDNVIWPALTGLMGEPKPDAGSTTSCWGGDDRVDISLVDVSPSSTRTSFTGCTAGPTPAYILFERGLSDPMPIVAHELMHAIQANYALHGGACISDSDVAFLAEGTAQWAQYFVYGTAGRVHDACEEFLDHPKVSYEVEGPPKNHDYGAYLLPLYASVAGGGNGVVKDMWDNAAGASPVDAVDAALPGGFAVVWKDFVLNNWNRDPVNTVYPATGLTRGAEPDNGGPAPLALGGKKIRSIPLNTDLAHLSARYKHLQVTDKNVKNITVYNARYDDPSASFHVIARFEDGTFDGPIDLSGGNAHNWCFDDGFGSGPRVTDIFIILGNPHKDASDDLPDDESFVVIEDSCFRCFNAQGERVGPYC